jgi:formylglycine-generating enzyme required for sulfatase activity
VVNLPTEAEWEYAARAGTETAFSYGNSLSSQQANFTGNEPYGDVAKGALIGRPTSVGSYAPNAWGLFDMHGNVLQWVKDLYDRGYRPTGNEGNSDRVMRGCFFFEPAQNCRSARRLQASPASRNTETRGAPPIGFRVVVRPRAT